MRKAGLQPRASADSEETSVSVQLRPIMPFSSAQSCSNMRYHFKNVLGVAIGRAICSAVQIRSLIMLSSSRSFLGLCRFERSSWPARDEPNSVEA